jgi:hypothetical protein
MALPRRRAEDRRMTTLHIDVRINDLAAWKAGYADHADVRRRAGVQREAVRHDTTDPSRLLIELDFASSPEATTFLEFLRENVWKDQPILEGTPEATILEPVELP